MEKAVSELPWPWKPTQRSRPPEDTFFEEGNLLCSQHYKYMREAEGTDEEEDEQEVLPCHLPGCTKVLTSIASYELHYNSSHRHVCRDCRRTFPSAHLLDIHVLEWHDAMFELLAARQNMYQCLVEACTQVFHGAAERKDHLVSCHKYPASYRFHRQKKLTHRINKAKQSGKQTAESMDGVVTESLPSTHSPADVQSSQLTTHNQTHPMDTASTSTNPKERTFVYKVPKTITFGQGVQRSFHRQRQPGKKKSKSSSHWHQVNSDPSADTSVNIEEVHMTDLADALDAR